MVRTRAITQPSAADEDARTKETAATLVTVASFPKVHEQEETALTAPLLRLQSEAELRSQQSPVTPLSATIGLGIDPSLVMEKQDATEAAIKAVRDAMDRCVVRFPFDNSSLRIHVKLGVPPKVPGQSEPMHVDVSRITPFLPPTIAVLPVEVVVGGLLVPQPHASGNKGLCTVVACISLQQAGGDTQNFPMSIASPTSVTTSSVPSRTPTSTTVAAAAAAAAPDALVASPPASWVEVEHSTRPRVGNDMAPPHAPTRHEKQPGARQVVSHSKSMEMLARISAEIHEQQPPPAEVVTQNGPASAAMKDNFSDSNYKKLPPGMTPKNNKRLFVKHSYKDYSLDAPVAEELDLALPDAPLLTPNAAFPLKLHETLTHIELDGHDDIIGWLPHGRSFKIHKQKEFVQTILPKYFVMTKKSSFLRQLNLYGFNRLSGIGPDQGSYYHEKFLRGLKFLSRRMSRQKVNGNGIRSAGNPDDEPGLGRFPPCPPTPRAPASDVATLFVQPIVPHRKDSVDANSDPILRTNAGIQVSFPLKLQRILDKLEAEGKTDCISWLPHGRAFLVHDSDRLVSELLPVYFNQTRYSSFQRQLHMYCFQRITAGRDKGAYHHACFQRGMPQISLKMHRTRVNGKGTRRPGNPNNEPDFYVLDTLAPIAPGTKIEIPVDLPNVDDEGSAASGASGDS